MAANSVGTNKSQVSANRSPENSRVQTSPRSKALLAVAIIANLAWMACLAWMAFFA